MAYGLQFRIPIFTGIQYTVYSFGFNDGSFQNQFWIQNTEYSFILALTVDS